MKHADHIANEGDIVANALCDIYCEDDFYCAIARHAPSVLILLYAHLAVILKSLR